MRPLLFLSNKVKVSLVESHMMLKPRLSGLRLARRLMSWLIFRKCNLTRLTLSPFGPCGPPAPAVPFIPLGPIKPSGPSCPLLPCGP